MNVSFFHTSNSLLCIVATFQGAQWLTSLERWAANWQAHIWDPLLPLGRVSSRYMLQLLSTQQFESWLPQITGTQKDPTTGRPLGNGDITSKSFCHGSFSASNMEKKKNTFQGIVTSVVRETNNILSFMQMLKCIFKQVKLNSLMILEGKEITKNRLLYFPSEWSQYIGIIELRWRSG